MTNKLKSENLSCVGVTFQYWFASFTIRNNAASRPICTQDAFLFHTDTRPPSSRIFIRVHNKTDFFLIENKPRVPEIQWLLLFPPPPLRLLHRPDQTHFPLTKLRKCYNTTLKHVFPEFLIITEFPSSFAPPPRMHHLSKRIKWWCGVTCKSNVCIPLTMAFTGKHRSFPEIQKLISEYEKYRFLYDTNSSEYIDRDKKRMAWEAIGRAMETTGKWRLLNTSSVYGITHWEKREWILLMISPFACHEQ